MNANQITEKIANNLSNKGYELSSEFTHNLEFLLAEFPNTDEAADFLYSFGRTLNEVYGDIQYNR